MIRAKLEKMRVGDLVTVPNLYPRRKLNDYNISGLADALRAGAKLPPIVIDQDDRIVDGYHRHLAYLRVFGPDYFVEVERRHYDSDLGMFLDAAALNATHGERLTRSDEIHVVNVAKSLGADDFQLAVALTTDEDHVKRLQMRVVISKDTGERIPSKIVSRHLEGKKVTAGQIAALDRGPGVAPRRLVNDITAWLKAGLLDAHDEALIAALRNLAHLILARYGEEEATG